VFDHDLSQAATMLVAIAQLARQIAPELEIHGSTQPCF